MSSSFSIQSNSASTKSVGFEDIEILEFHYILGDNPSVTSGCPIALGSELVQKCKVNVESYEQARGKRKNRKKLVIPVPTRAQILLKQGYSIDQIADCTIEAERIKSERADSISSQKWDKVNEISEGFVRVLRKAIPGSAAGPKKLIVVANSA